MRAVAFSPDSQYLAHGSDAKEVRLDKIGDIEKVKKIEVKKIEVKSKVSAVYFMDNDTLLVGCTGKDLLVFDLKKVRATATSPDKPDKKYKSTKPANMSWSFSSSGKRAAWGGVDRKTKKGVFGIFDLSTDNAVRSRDFEFEERVLKTALSPNFLAVGGEHGR